MVLAHRNKGKAKATKASHQDDDTSLIKHTSATCVSMADEAFRNQDYQTAIVKYIESIRMILPSQDFNRVDMTTETMRQYCVATSTLLKLFAVYCKNNDEEDAQKSLHSAKALIEKVLPNINDENINENRDSFLIRVSALTLYPQIMEAQGDIYYASQDYTKADETYHEALNWKEESIETIEAQENFEKKMDSDMDMANLLKKTGEVLFFRGNYVPSASALSESLSIRLQAGKDYSDKAIIALLKTLLQVHMELHDYSEAIHYMTLLEEKSDIEKTFDFRIQKSKLYALNLDFQVAMNTATDALEFSNSQGKNYNERMLSRATATTQIANVLEAQGSFTDAILWQQRARQIRLDILSNTNQDVVQNTKSIASIYMKREEYNKAKDVYKQIRDDLLKAHGTKHLSVSELMDDLGSVYYEQHHFSTALKCFQKGLEIRKQCTKEVTADLDKAQNMERIACCLLRHGKRFEAMELFAEAMDILRKNHYCQKHPKMQKLVQSMTANEDEYCDYDAEGSTVATLDLS